MREDSPVLSVDDFERLRQETCASGRASDGDDLLGMEIDFGAYLAGGAFPDASAAITSPLLLLAPPRYVAKTVLPEASLFTM